MMFMHNARSDMELRFLAEVSENTPDLTVKKYGYFRGSVTFSQ